MALLLGCDPEVFVLKNGRKRFHTSAYGMCEGTKKNPVKVDKGAVQVDGMALEFNIDPVNNVDDWVYNINRVMSQMLDFLPKDHSLSIVPVAHFQKPHFEAQPEAAVKLGCDPDFNAWKGGAINPRPNGKVHFRTGAGHIHFGWGENLDVTSADHIKDCCLLTKALDLTLYPLSTMWDKDEKRRKLYGKPGAFRPKPYGCEYRVLSNAWLKSPLLMHYVFETCTAVFNALQNLDHPCYIIDRHRGRVLSDAFLRDRLDGAIMYFRKPPV